MIGFGIACRTLTVSTQKMEYRLPLGSGTLQSLEGHQGQVVGAARAGLELGEICEAFAEQLFRREFMA
jgi:hypothetical protein